MNPGSRAGLGLLVVAGCAAEPTPSATLVAPGAVWIAVRTTEEPAWRRVEGGVAQVATDGDFEAVVVCREDVGGGWTWLATPGDAEDGDGGPRFERMCRAPGGATVVFDVVGEVDAIFVGDGVSYGPTFFSADVAPGAHDVVAVRNAVGGSSPERVQILRGVRVEAGSNRIAIDVEALGQPVATATIELDGAAPDFFVAHHGTTAGGTWFQLQTSSFDPTVVLPPTLRVEGDRELAYIPFDDGRWVDVEIRAGANALTTAAPRLEPTFAVAAGALSVTWPATDRWDRVQLGAWRTVNNTSDYPSWTLVAYPGAIERRTTDGTATLVMAAPDVAGWQPGWFTDFTMPYRRSASWLRYRPDGSDGYAQGDSITP